MERPGHCDGIVPYLACIVTKQHGVRGGKYLLKTPGNAISKTVTLNFKMSLDASALKHLYIWCEFHSHLQFIISLLLKNFLMALVTPMLFGHASLFMIILFHISCRYFGHTSLVCLQIWRACHWTEYIPCYACLQCKIPPPASAVWMT